jgi:cation transport regulator
MPYEAISDLPGSARDQLPDHAQEIYEEAFNHAWQECASPESRRGNASREETAHKVAWNAVKQKYKKDAGHWVRKPNYT